MTGQIGALERKPMDWARWAPKGVLTWTALACQSDWQDQRRKATRTVHVRWWTARSGSGSGLAAAVYCLVVREWTRRRRQWQSVCGLLCLHLTAQSLLPRGLPLGFVLVAELTGKS